MKHITMAVAGMSCDGCIRAVRNALEAVPGVQVDSVKVGSASASYDELRATPAALAQAIRKAGYQPMAAGVPVAPLVKDAVRCGCGHAHGRAEARR